MLYNKLGYQPDRKFQFTNIKDNKNQLFRGYLDKLET